MNSTTLASGFKLGMFPGIDPSTAYKTPFNLQSFSQSPEVKTGGLQDNPLFQMLSPEAKERAIERQLGEAGQADILKEYFQAYRPPTAQEADELDERRMRRAQEIGKESLQEGFKYSMLASIPKTITQAATAAAAMKLAAGESMQQGGRNILDAYSRMQLPSSPMYQPQKYFG
jgi:hypothetical protein